MDNSAESSSVQVKGTAVKSIAQFVEDVFSKEKKVEWIASLPEDTKKIFEGLVVSSQWYSLETAYNVPLIKIGEMFFNGDNMKGAEEAGKYSAQMALKGVYKFFVKLGTPGFIIRKASNILPTYFKPSAIEVVADNSKDAILRITKFPGISNMVENRIKGWILAALEVSGAKNPKVEITKSLAEGDEYTDYNMSWE